VGLSLLSREGAEPDEPAKSAKPAQPPGGGRILAGSLVGRFLMSSVSDVDICSLITLLHSTDIAGLHCFVCSRLLLHVYFFYEVMLSFIVAICMPHPLYVCLLFQYHVTW